MRAAGRTSNRMSSCFLSGHPENEPAARRDMMPQPPARLPFEFDDAGDPRLVTTRAGGPLVLEFAGAALPSGQIGANAARFQRKALTHALLTGLTRSNLPGRFAPARQATPPPALQHRREGRAPCPAHALTSHRRRPARAYAALDTEYEMKSNTGC